MDFYREKRWKVQCPVQLFTEDLVVGGRTVDISLQGLCVATDSSIKRGAHVVVQVGGCPIDGVLYTVQWVDQGWMGLEVGEISATEQRRLQDRLIALSLDQDRELVGNSTSLCLTIEQPITSVTDTVAVLWHLLFPGHHAASVSKRSLPSLLISK